MSALGIEDIDLAGDDEHGISMGGIQLECLIARELEMNCMTVVDGELEADHATERSDALDTGFPAGLAIALAADFEIVGADIDLGAGLPGEPQSAQRVSVFTTGADLDRLRRQDVDLAQELGHERALGPLVESLRRANLLDPPIVEHDDLVGNLECLALIVGDKQAGHVNLVVQFSQPRREARRGPWHQGHQRARRARGPSAPAPAHAPGQPADADRPRAGRGSARRSRRAVRAPVAGQHGS